MERFKRIEALIGKENMQRLAGRSVTIVGVGAVGGYAIEGLARAGVGHLRLVDFDKVEKSNINRQIIALESTIGEYKVEAAAKRVKDINPHCVVEALPTFAREDSYEEIFTPQPDLVIDAIDSLNPKVGLIEGAVQRQIPIISSMGAALRTDPRYISFGSVFDSKGCPLARHVRKRLRNRGVTGGVSCVYSSESVDFSYEQPLEPLADPSQGRMRNILGSMPTITGIFGLTIANYAIMALIKEVVEIDKP